MWQNTETEQALKREFPQIVICSQISADELEALNERGKRRVAPAPLPRATSNKRLLNAWVDFLTPHFGPDSANLTGTYSDEYGYSHGLMLTRNVIKDFQSFRRRLGRSSDPASIGVEFHPSTHRAVLHFHAMIGGAWTPEDLRIAQAEWVRTRGWAVAKQVTDAGGCAGYVCKHLLKQGSAGDTLEFWLPPEIYGSRIERRLAGRGEL